MSRGSGSNKKPPVKEVKLRGSKPPETTPAKTTTPIKTTTLRSTPPKKRRNVFQRAWRSIQLYFVKLYTSISKDKNRLKTIAIAGGGVLLFLLLTIIIYNSVKKNAYSIQVGENRVAVIKMGKENICEELEQQAVLKIESSVGSRIRVNEEITHTPIHASKKDMISAEEAIAKISGALTYRVEAFALSVEGTHMVTLKSQSEAESILDSIINPYLMDGVKIIEKGFQEDVRIDSIYVEIDEVDDKEKALRILTSTLETAQTYTAVSGDSLGIIASRAGMSMEQILEINPNLTLGGILRIGDVINLTVDKPLIAVRTVEERSFIDVEPIPIKYEQNPNERTSYQRTLKYGTVGQAEVIQHVIRINGTESEIVDVERKITLAPEPEIIEVGTRQ